MFQFEREGNYDKTLAWLDDLEKGDFFGNLDRYGQMGVDSLSDFTPKESGLTAASWEFEVTQTKGAASIRWYNTNVNDGEQIAILIQYGHGTGTGGYVFAQDYVNPAMDPVFDAIVKDFRKEVSR